MNPSGSSVYPQHPPGSRLVFRVPGSDLTMIDRVIVAGSSLFIVGSVVWVPFLTSWAWRKYKLIPRKEKRRRALYAALVLAATGLFAFGPHRHVKVGKWLQIRKWKLWQAWLRFIAMEVISDQVGTTSTAPPATTSFDAQKDQAIFAFVPHGIFPFAFAFGVLPEMAQRAFGVFRPVVATATQLFPVVRDILLYAESIDASRPSVDRALSQGERVGIVPGGIAEIFEGYPKASTHPDEEYSIVRKGFLRMAIRHQVPVVPVYCFGATKMMHRLQLPILERLSLLLRISIVVFFGKWGLPIPFRQRLLYVMGQPIFPPMENGNEEQQVGEMHTRFCNELMRVFDRHKEAYGWAHKTLKLISP